MEKHKADKIYRHYYNLAKQDGFDDDVSHFLALKPARYVYDALINQGHIKYCFDLLDDEFNSLSPVELEQMWIFDNNGICPTFNKREMIRTEYTIKRNNLKKLLYNNEIEKLKRNDAILSKQFNPTIDPINDITFKLNNM
jgi:hypothetical protein